MNSNQNVVANFVDQFGETKIIHNTRHGLCVKRRADTPCQILSKVISGYVGERVREIRMAKKMSAEELCLRAGLCRGSTPKGRIYEIEKNKRSLGLRFGTLYLLAMALEVEIGDLLPSACYVKNATGARLTLTTTLTIN